MLGGGALGAAGVEAGAPEAANEGGEATLQQPLQLQIHDMLVAFFTRVASIGRWRE